jgi:hypothetical protein
MVISAIIGVGFGLVFGAKALDFGSGALWGAIYGVIWWILGPLLIMPIMMGMALRGLFSAVSASLSDDLMLAEEQLMQ